LHMAQLMPLPLTVSCFSKIQIGSTFLVPAHLGSPGQRAVKRVCVCACVLRHELSSACRAFALSYAALTETINQATRVCKARVTPHRSRLVVGSFYACLLIHETFARSRPTSH